ncbi:hypothetical protein [uncultured Clostridium sp.]|uniref:hypothetical protein n=1 Tax=uncultured Clostridium sp. TaxID=59620 RepID=UPI0028EDFAE8|nr:hypothetical protein [uncultured Clostridium sp.]
MNKNNKFDSLIKSAMDDSANNIKASRDIFNDTWNKKEQGVTNMSYFKIKNIKRAALITACCAAFSIVGVFIISPEVRAAAQEVFRTIFITDESGNIVERSEDEKVPVAFGSVPITNENKKDMERRSGFKINLPEKIGNYSYEKIEDYVMEPGVVIMADDVKYKDSDEVSDKLKKAIDDEQTFDELSKDYELTIMPSSTYEDNKGHKFHLTLFKYSENSSKQLEDDEKEININDIKCRISQGTSVKYNVKENSEGEGVTDLENKPTAVDERYDMEWNYDGVRYCLYIGNDSSHVDAAKQFAEDYIKILKQS